MHRLATSTAFLHNAENVFSVEEYVYFIALKVFSKSGFKMFQLQF